MVEFEGVKDIGSIPTTLKRWLSHKYGERIVEGHLANPEM
jgi:hypothetical protein